MFHTTKAQISHILSIIAIGILVFFILSSMLSINVEHSLSYKAITYVVIFFMVITALVIEVLPPSLIGLIGVVTIASINIVGTPKEAVSWALSGFSNSVIWLIFTAFMLAKGYAKSGLGRRVALLLIKYLGKRTLTLGYAVAAIEFILAPFIPSNTARSAGTICPIIKNIPILYDCTPTRDRRKIGSYLMWVGIASTCVTSTLFLTGLAPNLLAVSIVEKSIGLKINWMSWFKLTAIPFTALLMLVPLLTYIIYPPTVKKSNHIIDWVNDEISKLKSIKRSEVLMMIFSILALCLWLFAGKYLHSTMVAMLVLVLMVLCKVITFDDIINHSSAWSIFIWFATLVALAGGLKTVGFLSWVGDISNYYLHGLKPIYIFISIILIFYIIHYCFASVTAHTTALLPIMITIANNTLPSNMITPLVYSLVFSLGIMGILTPYASGPSPIWYGAGYISSREYWKLGLIFGSLFLVVLLILSITML